MARRIALTILALIGVLLVTTVVPLGMITTEHERDNFHDDAVAAANTLAAVAEEILADHKDAPALTEALTQARGDGESVAVYDSSGRVVTGTGPGEPTVASAVVDAAFDQGTHAVPATAEDQLLVMAPVRRDGSTQAVGAVALARPTGHLDAHIGMLWGWLALVFTVGLAAAAALAVRIARWVSRPLHALDAAAQRLGDGALETRSPAGRGPVEVRRLAGNFNTMAGRLEALVHGHRAMMADVSHQLRTPLAALRLRLDVLAQDADPPTAGELADAQGEIARLSRLVDGLLAVARAENVVTSPVPVSVSRVAEERIAAWYPVAQERGVELTAGPRTTARVSLGEGHLEQILDNLLANALDAVPAGGRVWVATRRVDGRPDTVSVEVADDGPGMAPELREAAFRRFATSAPGRTGLGLAIVHRLVTSNGGAASLTQTPGGGLTVTLLLPAAR